MQVPDAKTGDESPAASTSCVDDASGPDSLEDAKVTAVMQEDPFIVGGPMSSVELSNRAGLTNRAQ